MSKILIAIVAGLALLGGAWFFYQGQAPSSTSPESTSQTLSNAPPPPPGAPQGSPATASGSADASLENDLSAVDSQLKGLDSDNAAVDQSMNDKPVAQDNF